jgi:3-oxoacyl-[acyl-carrier-protein] synthase II
MDSAGSRIGVAGLGFISPLGDDIDSAWARLMAGESGIQRLSLPGLPDSAAAQVLFDPAKVLTTLQQIGTDRVSQIALGAARNALVDADIPGWPDAERVGLFVGTGMGGAAAMETGYRALYEGNRVPPLTVPSSMVNGPAAVIAINTGIRGPVITYAVACASSAVAIAEAAHALRRGEIDIALAGGTEAPLVRGTVAAWQALRTLAPPDKGDVGRSCRPFSSDRAGLVLGEGAAFLVLQREDDLGHRGHGPRAWLAGSAVRCDASHLTNPDVRGQAATIKASLQASGLSPSQIGYCNAHGTATMGGDPVECEGLRQVWGNAAGALHVSSTKAAHGHLLGAAGALEACWTVLAVQRGEIPPTRGVRSIDPRCEGVAHVLGAGVQQPALRHAASNSFAFGGTDATLIFSRA